MKNYNKNDVVKIIKNDALFECKILSILPNNRIQVYCKEREQFRSQIIKNDQVIPPFEDKKPKPSAVENAILKDDKAKVVKKPKPSVVENAIVKDDKAKIDKKAKASKVF